MRSSDPIEQIARLRDAAQPPDSADGARRVALTALQHAIACEHREASPTRASGWRLTHRPRRLVLAGAIVAGISSVVGVGYASLSTSVSPSLGVGCHVDQKLDGSVAVHSLDGRSALAVCAEDWRNGSMTPDKRQVPTLQACVSPSGDKPIHVFPGTDPKVCSRFSMRSDPLAGTDPGAQRYVRFSRALRAAFSATASRCPAEPETQAIIREQLDRNGLNDWTIRAVSEIPPGRCADFYLDSTAKAVDLFPAGEH